MPSVETPQSGELEAMPRIELVSLYMNRYASFDEARRGAFEAEFRRRGLPLPDMSASSALSAAPRTIEAERRGSAASLDRPTTLSYILLIYTLTGLVYSWIFLVTRLIQRDFGKNPKHMAIQTAISIVYIAIEGIVFLLLAGD